MKYFSYPALSVLLLLLLAACKNEDQYDKYARPDWLAGKVYTQILEDPELSTFAKCVELIGYDTILDVSGSYTIFAPDNAAFDQYFLNNASYASPEEMPLDELSALVKFHIVQNPWTKEQLVTLDVWGWIDTLDINNDVPRGYKRKTLLLEDEFKFGISRNPDEKDLYILKDTLETSWHRKIVRDSRKHVPIFFKDYLDIYDLNSADYEFYFDRPIESADDIFYAGARVKEDEVFAENGFIYKIDRVVEPMKNLIQLLSDDDAGYSYSEFRKLLYQFPELEYNEQRTFEQAGAEQGYEVDSLFNLTFPELAFIYTNEKTKAPSGSLGLPDEVTIRYHHGLIAPTNSAMENFTAEYFDIPNGWQTIDLAPRNIKRIIANTHMSQNPIYLTDMQLGFYNGESDLITVDENTAVQKEYGTNATFVGVNKAIVPRAFSSVTGPVYLQKGYSFTMYAIEAAGLLPALKRESQQYTFYVESDLDCRKDSSLLYSAITERFSAFVTAGIRQPTYLSQYDLRTLLMNHIGVEPPRGAANIEYIRNMAGNFLVVNNVTGEVSGTGTTTEGYDGLPRTEPDIPVQISDNADNGVTYSISDWFSFNAASLYLTIKTDYPEFHALLNKAGLARNNESTYSFISRNEVYTVLIPTPQALIDVEADTLSGQNLVDFLQLHFIVGDFIFTDGNKNAAYYPTARVDESSTAFSKKFTSIYLDPAPDLLTIPNASGGTFVDIPEAGDATNRLVGRTTSSDQTAFPEIVNTGVIHEISKALWLDDLDTSTK